jgi:hypothetical protein
MSHEHYIILAHNLKGFDGCFILKYILENLLPQDKNNPVNYIVTGTKIMSITNVNLSPNDKNFIINYDSKYSMNLFISRS